MSVAPRQIAFKGTIEAIGIVLDRTILTEDELRRRLVSEWSTGSRAFAIDADHVVLRWPEPHRVRVDQAFGAPLVASDAIAIAAPLEDDELEALDALPNGAIVLVRGGLALAVPPGEQRTIDPASWIDLGPARLVKVEPIAPPPLPVALAIAPPPPLRERLAAPGMNREPPEARAIMEALRRAREDGAVEQQPSSMKERLALAKSSLARIFSSLSKALRSTVAPGTEHRAASEGKGAKRSLIDPRSPPSRPLFEKLRGFFSRLFFMSRLSSLIGQRHARYLSRLMEMFEEGDLASALRHAIPLDSGKGGEPSPPSLSLPTPRRELRIGAGGEGSGSAILLEESLFARLRRLYRAAFERLEREGRIEEAAFVLAELLHQSEEAVAFLERHGKLRLAAELAEARELPPGLVIRQWFLAGDVERAVRVARKHAAFADAVMRLEQSRPQEAKKLRLLWADTLAEAGDYVAAIAVIWPIEDARQLARAWLDRAIGLGGLVGARMIANKAALFPESFGELRPVAIELLDSEEPESVEERLALAEGLLEAGGGPAVEAISRPMLRAVLRDRGRGETRIEPSKLTAFARLAKDPALVADLPLLPPPVLRPKGELLRLEVSLEDTGTIALHDAVLLSGGRSLVALGEAGAALISSRGKILARFDHPAHHLVISDHADRAIAIAPRGEVMRLSKIDLSSRRSAHWTEVRIDRWAESFDGSIWFVADGQTVSGIDVLAKRCESLWRVSEIGGPVRTIVRSPASLSFVVDSDRAVIDVEDGHPLFLRMPVERWRFELPGLVLRSRLALPRGLREIGLAADGRVVGEDASGKISGQPDDGRPSISPGESPAQVIEASAGFIAVTMLRTDEPSVAVEVHDLSANRVAKLRLGGARTAKVRLFGSELVVCDLGGRLIRLGLERREVLSSCRI
jgi:hypothetical protein